MNMAEAFLGGPLPTGGARGGSGWRRSPPLALHRDELDLAALRVEDEGHAHGSGVPGLAVRGRALRHGVREGGVDVADVEADGAMGRADLHVAAGLRPVEDQRKAGLVARLAH